MVAVNVRELSHNFSAHLKKVQAGEKIIIMMRNKPIAEISPYQEKGEVQGWKRKVTPIRLKGAGLTVSEMVIKARMEEKH